ncbi:hypothetical protein BH24ACT23_BH24ACT23_03900 [soil metagenome]
MYRFSRSIYRELAPRVVEDGNDDTGCRNRQAVLEACEGAIRRLSTDRRYFARPARSLFGEVRMHFAMTDQLYVWQVIERNIALAIDLLETAPEVLEIDGGPRECRAHTRKGTPCQREPLPARDYCPSHKHLEETFESAEVERDVFEEPLVAV